MVNDENPEQTVCSCNHVTNFAVLMQFKHIHVSYHLVFSQFFFQHLNNNTTNQFSSKLFAGDCPSIKTGTSFPHLYNQDDCLSNALGGTGCASRYSHALYNALHLLRFEFIHFN